MLANYINNFIFHVGLVCPIFFSLREVLALPLGVAMQHGVHFVGIIFLSFCLSPRRGCPWILKSDLSHTQKNDMCAEINDLRQRKSLRGGALGTPNLNKHFI